MNLTIWGVDEEITVAKRILDLMRPRMGPSAQATPPTDAASDDAAKAGAIVGGLVN